MEETKNGFEREILLSPWVEVALQFMKYITYEGKENMVYGFHFRLLHQLRNFLLSEARKELKCPLLLVTISKGYEFKGEKEKKDALL